MKYVILTLLPLLLLTACFKVDPPEIEPDAGNPEEEDALVAPEGFDFDMVYDYQFSVEVHYPDGRPAEGVPFWVYSARPKDGGRLLSKILSDENGQFDLQLSLPATQREVIAYTTERDIPMAQVIPLSSLNRVEPRSGGSTYQWGEDPQTNGAYELYEMLQSLYNVENDNCPVKFYQVLGNTLKQLNPIDGTYVTIGSASRNFNGIGLNTEDGELYGISRNGNDNELWLINKDTGAETNLGAVTNMTGGGYSYRSDFDLDGNLTIINKINGTWTLAQIDVSAFDSVKTATFIPLTATTSVSNIYDIAYHHEQNVYYSLDQTGNVIRIDPTAKTIGMVGDFGNITGNVTVGAVWSDVEGYLFFSENNGGRIFFSEVDDSGNPFNFRHISTGGTTSNNDGAACVLAPSPFDLITDTDNDGTPDLLDESPDDPNIEVVPTSLPLGAGNTGTYAFEDKWPDLGDYDFNDVVIDYAYNFTLNSGGKVTDIEATFVVKSIGAAWENGFGFSLEGLTPSKIQSVTGTEASSISTLANGCESGQRKAVIVVFDDGHALFGPVTTRQPINTLQNRSLLSPDTITVDIKLNSPASTAEIGLINPFIFSAGDRGREIHLMNYPPTDLVDPTYFGTRSDRSQSAQGKYYLDENNFPWGLSFPTTFTYPAERINVRTSYTSFDTWVTSSGASQVDWYLPNKSVTSKVITWR